MTSTMHSSPPCQKFPMIWCFPTGRVMIIQSYCYMCRPVHDRAPYILPLSLPRFLSLSLSLFLPSPVSPSLATFTPTLSSSPLSSPPALPPPPAVRQVSAGGARVLSGCGQAERHSGGGGREDGGGRGMGERRDEVRERQGFRRWERVEMEGE